MYEFAKYIGNIYSKCKYQGFIYTQQYATRLHKNVVVFFYYVNYSRASALRKKIYKEQKKVISFCKVL